MKGCFTMTTRKINEARNLKSTVEIDAIASIRPEPIYSPNELPPYLQSDASDSISRFNKLNGTNFDINTSPRVRVAFFSDVRYGLRELMRIGFDGRNNAGVSVHVDLSNLSDYIPVDAFAWKTDCDRMDIVVDGEYANSDDYKVGCIKEKCLVIIHAKLEQYYENRIIVESFEGMLDQLMDYREQRLLRVSNIQKHI